MDIQFFGDIQRPKAIVVRANARVQGISFFSPEDYSQQLGLMTRPAGYIVPMHRHNLVERKINQTQEVLIIRAGKCRVELFDGEFTLTDSIDLHAGDVILLAEGAHRIEMLTECEILEVKQGPYAGIEDKTILEKLDQ